MIYIIPLMMLFCLDARKKDCFFYFSDLAQLLLQLSLWGTYCSDPLIEAPRYFNWRRRPQKWPKLINKRNPIIHTHPGLQLLFLPLLLLSSPWGTYCYKSGWPWVNKGTPRARISRSNIAYDFPLVKWGALWVHWFGFL